MSKPGKTADLKAKRSTSKAKVEDLPHGKKDDSKGKKDKDESKTKKDDTKGKSDTKLKESKSKDKGSKDPSNTNLQSESASPVKTKSKSQLSPAGDESPTLPPTAQENLNYEEFLSPSTSDKNIRQDTEPTSEELTEPEPAKEPPAPEPKPKKKTKSPEADDVEKKPFKDKDSSSKSKKRQQEEKEASQLDSDSSPKKSHDHTPDETDSKRARSRSASRQDQEAKQEKTEKQQEVAKEKCESSEREAKRKRSWASQEQSESRRYKACELPDREHRKEKPSRPQDSQYRPQDSRYRPQDNRYKPQDNRYKPQDSRYRPQESSYRSQESHYRPYESHNRPNESQYRPQESHYRPQESSCRSHENSYRQEKNWDTRDRDLKREDWRSTERDFLKERACQLKESDYKKNKPWGSPDYKNNQICEHKESSYRRKSWRPSTSYYSQDKKWDEPKSDYKSDTSWKFQDEPTKEDERTYNSAPTCSTSFNNTKIETCRKTSYSTPSCQRGQFWSKGSTYREDKRDNGSCRCSVDQTKCPGKSRCMHASGQQPTRCCHLPKETVTKAQPSRVCHHQSEVKHSCMRGSINTTHQKICPRVQDRQTHTCQDRRKPACCNNRKEQCSRSPPCNPQLPQCFRSTPKRTCCAQSSAGVCLPRRLCCSVSRPTSCPAKDNDYCSNSGQSNILHQTNGCSYDRCSINKSPDDIGNSQISSPSYSWNRMQSCAGRAMNCTSPVQRSFYSNRHSCGLLTQHHSCMDFGTRMSGMCGCARSHSQHLMSLSRQEELLPNPMPYRSNSYLTSQQMYEPRTSFSEAKVMKPFPAYTPEFRRRVLNTTQKCSEFSITKLSPSASSYLARAATSQSFDSSNRRRNFRTSSFNRDTRASAYEAGATNRSLTEKDCSSSFESVSDFKSVSMHSLSSGLDLQKRSFSRD